MKILVESNYFIGNKAPAMTNSLVLGLQTFSIVHNFSRKNLSVGCQYAENSKMAHLNKIDSRMPDSRLLIFWSRTSTEY